MTHSRHTAVQLKPNDTSHGRRHTQKSNWLAHSHHANIGLVINVSKLSKTIGQSENSGQSGVTSNYCQNDNTAQPLCELAVQVKRLDADLPMPRYAHTGDAGIDLHARFDATLLPGGGRSLIPTGIAVALPLGYAGFVLPRSGLALKHGVTCLNTPGLIDSGYLGEIKVLLINTDPDRPLAITRGERIAQLVIQRVEQVRLTETIDLCSSTTDHRSTRGHQGFGSTGR